MGDGVRIEVRAVELMHRKSPTQSGIGQWWACAGRCKHTSRYTSKAERAMPRRSAEQTRRVILDAAYESFYRRGFARSSVDEIAGMADVTKRTLYYHFESKDQLLAAVLEMQHGLSLMRIRKY